MNGNAMGAGLQTFSRLTTSPLSTVAHQQAAQQTFANLTPKSNQFFFRQAPSQHRIRMLFAVPGRYSDLEGVSPDLLSEFTFCELITGYLWLFFYCTICLGDFFSWKSYGKTSEQKDGLSTSDQHADSLYLCVSCDSRPFLLLVHKWYQALTICIYSASLSSQNCFYPHTTIPKISLMFTSCSEEP